MYNSTVEFLLWCILTLYVQAHTVTVLGIHTRSMNHQAKPSITHHFKRYCDTILYITTLC